MAEIHKIYLNSTPIKISSFSSAINLSFGLSELSTQRDPQFLDIPKSRLFALDKTITIKGPKLYNYVTNLLIKKQTSEYPERKFLDPFKRMISGFLNTVQSKGGLEWEDENFTIYNFCRVRNFTIHLHLIDYLLCNFQFHLVMKSLSY